MKKQWFLLFLLLNVMSCQSIVESEDKGRNTIDSLPTATFSSAEHVSTELHVTLTAPVVPTRISSTNIPEVFLPHVPEPKEGETLVYPTAQFVGQLIQEGRCIRLQVEEHDVSYLVIWPPDYYYENIEGKIHILNGNGKVRAIVGETVELGGGIMPIRIESQIEPIVKESCKGPYLFGW